MRKYRKEFKEDALKLSEVPCSDGMLYVSPIMDCCSGEVLSPEMRDNMRKELCIDTVRNLIVRVHNHIYRRTFAVQKVVTHLIDAVYTTVRDSVF